MEFENQFQFLGETVTSVIPLKGAKLEAWRNKQTTKYLDSGLNPDEAEELVKFVEAPYGFYSTESHDRFNHLAGKAIEGGLLNRSETREAVGL